MAVMVPREDLTEHRLDALEKKVDEGFARVDGELREIRGDMKVLRGEVGDLGREMNARFDSLGRSLFTAAVAVIVALIGSSATLAGIALF